MDELLIFNMKNAHPRQAIKVDRSSPWGNPFILGKDGDRDDVCDLFEQYAKWRLTIQPSWLRPLKGKYLACWCAPLRCHAETLRRLSNDQPHRPRT